MSGSPLKRWLRALTAAVPYVRRPRSAVLHLRWHAHRGKNNRIRREIRPFFDEQFYITAYPEVRRLKLPPIMHYILTGWREGKDPSETFSTTAYLEANHDVAASKVNPLRHFVNHGRHEGRPTRVSGARQKALRRPSRVLRVPPLPSEAEWAALPRRVLEPPTRAGVDVIVPVYKSLPHVATTLASVLGARCETAFELLVVDDASPEPEVSALLARLAASGHIRLLVNPRNLGFVRSVNRGMAEHEHRDVVLLNADTLVHDGWLDRLTEPFHTDPSIATVTALSNNATIASYPDTAVDNGYELEVTSARLDRLAAEANPGTVVDIPTGIGFCMAIRRKTLAELGLFDAEAFGAGYGEECDFSMRALKAGWRNVLAVDVYVRHYGSTSFGAEMNARSAAAQVAIAAKHPDYHARVARHLAADPALPARILLDAARLREALGPISVLFLSHTRGGGIETYLRYVRQALEEDGLGDIAERAVVLQTIPQGFVQVASFTDRLLPYLPNLEALNLERHKDLLLPLVRLLEPELIHVNSFAGLSASAIGRLMGAIRSSGRPYWHVWHDHQPLCPRLTFLDAEDRYCGETDATRCGPCLAATSAPFEWVRIDDWRAQFRDFLAGASVVSAPSEAAALRARRLTDVAKVEVHPHPERHLLRRPPLRRPRREGLERRVAVLGAIGPHKGAHLLHAMLQDMRQRRLALHLDVVGYTSVREIATGPHCTVHGRYGGDTMAADRLEAIQPDVLLCSSVWPETYVFTLSVAMALELPIVTFDIGAQAERVRAYGRGAVLDRRLMDDPLALNDALLALDVDALWAQPASPVLTEASALSVYFRTLREPPAPAREERGAPEGRMLSAEVLRTPLTL